MRHASTFLTLAIALFVARTAAAVLVPGGGARAGDCMSVFDTPSGTDQ